MSELSFIYVSDIVIAFYCKNEYIVTFLLPILKDFLVTLFKKHALWLQIMIALISVLSFNLYYEAK